MVYLTPDINGTMPSGQCGHEKWTCKGRCRDQQQSYNFLENLSEIQICHCDNMCLNLGDCCYDYLYECGSLNYTLKEGIKKQAEIFLQLKPYFVCVKTYIQAAIHEEDIAYDAVSAYMVATCPPSADARDFTLCNKAHSLKSVSAHTPVHWKGLLYRNIFCAACHGAPLAEVGWMQAELLCRDTGGSYKGQKEKCSLIRLAVDDSPVDMTRLVDHCWIQECNADIPGAVCSDEDSHAEECRAYRAIFHVDSTSSSVTYQNEACQRCDSDPANTGPLKCFQRALVCMLSPIGKVYHAQWMNFFDFTGRYASHR